jgi:hypothetical protein
VLLLFGGIVRAEEAPKFADYPSPPVYHGRNAAPVLRSWEARMYRTRIREGARERPNFDGHYIVVGWGCGTQCWNGAVVDAITGKVVVLPVVAASLQQDAELIEYRIDSRLMVLNGMSTREEESSGSSASHYFEFNGKILKPVKTIPRPEWQSRATGDDKPQ